jgi:mannosyl-3-phosphoglycerate phosphatase family protein
MSPKVGSLNSSAVVVFSDLDGSLLDHHSYSYAPAQPGIQRLQEQAIPLVLATSKTRDEVLVFISELGLDTPFIIENGGGILVPGGYFEAPGGGMGVYEEVVLSTPVSELQSVLEQARLQGLVFRSMLEMSVDEIVQLTGLKPEEAERAAHRHYTIPLVWQDSDERLHDFTSLIEAAGYTLLKGGRFYHLQGGTDKSVAMRELVARYETVYGKPVTSIALGDSGNDRRMLETADYAVVIPPAGGEPMKLDKKQGVFTASFPGPKGWNEGLMITLDTINQRILHE